MCQAKTNTRQFAIVIARAVRPRKIKMTFVSALSVKSSDVLQLRDSLA